LIYVLVNGIISSTEGASVLCLIVMLAKMLNIPGKAYGPVPTSAYMYFRSLVVAHQLCV
jgi:hypothetical protein